MIEHIEQIANEIVDPIKRVEENMERNCYKRHKHWKNWEYCSSVWQRRPKWKRLSKDKGIGGVLFRIKEHPHEKRDNISDALNIGKGTCGEYVQTLLKAEMITWTRKTHYEISPLGLAVLKLFNIV